MHEDPHFILVDPVFEIQDRRRVATERPDRPVFHPLDDGVHLPEELQLGPGGIGVRSGVANRLLNAFGVVRQAEAPVFGEHFARQVRKTHVQVRGRHEFDRATLVREGRIRLHAPRPFVDRTTKAQTRLEEVVVRGEKERPFGEVRFVLETEQTRPVAVREVQESRRKARCGVGGGLRLTFVLRFLEYLVTPPHVGERVIEVIVHRRRWIDFVLHDGRRMGFLLFFGPSEFARVVDRLACVFVLFNEELQNARVAEELRVLLFGRDRLEVADERLLRLTVAVHAAVTLLEGHERPGDVEVNEPVAETMQVQAFARDVGREHEAHGILGAVEFLNGVHEVLVAVVPLQNHHLLGLQTHVLREVFCEEVERLTAFRENNESVVRRLRPAEGRLEGVASREKVDERQVLRELRLVDERFEVREEAFENVDVVLRVFVAGERFELLQAVLDGRNAGRGARKERLREGRAKELAPPLVLRVDVLELQLRERPVDRVLRGIGVDADRFDRAVGEFLRGFAADVVFETSNDEALPHEVLRFVVLPIGEHRRVEHVDQAREALGAPVVRGGGKHDEGVGALREKARELRALTHRAAFGDVVRFVDQDDVPVRVFEERAVLGALQGDRRFWRF